MKNLEGNDIIRGPVQGIKIRVLETQDSWLALREIELIT